MSPDNAATLERLRTDQHIRDFIDQTIAEILEGHARG